MAKIAYFQCPTGISGDMCLGALVHAGVPLDYLKEKLQLLGISAEYELKSEPVRRQGQLATKVSVNLTQQNSDHHDHHHSTATRHLSQIEAIILQAKLPQQVEIWSLAIFRKLAQAEAAVHGIPVEEVHFHEVGATDAIVDIVGTCLGLDWFNIKQFYCSTLPTGGGTVWAAHGQLPVPAPAVLKLFEIGKVPVYSNGIERELVTPTGAAIAVTLAQGFGEPPALSIQTIGLGAGSRDLPIPNILRLWVGEQYQSVDSDIFSTVNTEIQTIAETICVLQTQIDDLSPQVIAYTFELLFQAGAIDVFSQP
ncbi:MAG: nickel pincer cofactor biosynthesis protein LarC, partial [Planktothrix sp.]